MFTTHLNDTSIEDFIVSPSGVLGHLRLIRNPFLYSECV